MRFFFTSMDYSVIETGREKIVELLIQNGADIDPRENEKTAYAPLSAAASNGKFFENSISALPNLDFLFR